LNTPDQGFAPIEEAPDEADSAPIGERADEMQIDLHPQSTDIGSGSSEIQAEERPIRPGPNNGTKTSIIVELPRKTADYYKDFKQIEKALLVDNYDKENNIVLLTNLNDEPSTYK